MTTAQQVFRLDSSTGVPFYRQIIDQVLLAMADGRLKPGTQLPTVRQLAVDLSVNLNTIAKAYREMEIRGIVQTQQGTGTFVAARTGAKTREKRKALQDLLDRFLANAEAHGIPMEELVDALAERAEKARRREA
ncbi:MAG TPA: GntR family transcriptional regulator [Thermoanaerobaculia bacterium]|nr:GntR family transcriptional regulator [Thermoanaerobaculia bacterium]